MKSTTATASELLTEQDRLTAELAALEEAIDDADTDLIDAERLTREADHTRNQTLGRLNNRRATDPDAAAEIRRTEEGWREAGAEERRRLEALAALRQRREAIREALSALAGGSLPEIQAADRLAREARETVARLQALIDERRASLAEHGSDPLAELDAERARLLAAVALGESDPAALEEIEHRRLDALEHARQLDDQRARETALVQGLQERLRAAQIHADMLEAVHHQAVVLYLKDERSRAAIAYAQAAETLFERFGEVIGFQRVLSGLDPSADLRGEGETGHELRIPPVNLGAAKALDLWDAGDFRANATAAVRARLLDQGVRLGAASGV
ncbi:hypothetical protein [Thiocystis violacea]|uniref:hypothetical protein n=1 Tax=Thiocystis violacea TaxID=13725 RepID=UPI0019030EDA|nr:hypothetical protein [Thiocystis violacea]MBK1716672.1 hypothetical protein [Thiocystis violacea]